MEWVCDCASLPISICNDEVCELAYRMIGKIKSTQDLVNKYKSNYPEELIDEELPVIPIEGNVEALVIHDW